MMERIIVLTVSCRSCSWKLVRGEQELQLQMRANFHVCRTLHTVSMAGYQKDGHRQVCKSRGPGPSQYLGQQKQVFILTNPQVCVNHAWRLSGNSAPSATHFSGVPHKSRAIDIVSAQKALEGSETIELLGGTKANSYPPDEESFVLPSS